MSRRFNMQRSRTPRRQQSEFVIGICVAELPHLRKKKIIEL